MKQKMALLKRKSLKDKAGMSFNGVKYGGGLGMAKSERSRNQGLPDFLGAFLLIIW
jgi:hypothetical protein